MRQSITRSLIRVIWQLRRSLPAHSPMKSMSPFACPYSLEADPHDIDGRGDHLLARHLRMITPPDRQPGQAGSDHFGLHLERQRLLVVDVDTMNLTDDDAKSDSCLVQDLFVESQDLRFPGRFLEVHPHRVRMVPDVAGPGIDGAWDADLGGVIGGEVLAPRRQQLVPGALEQAPMNRLLGFEVVVQDRGRDTGPASDFVDRRAVIAALGEDIRGGPLNHLAAVVRCEPPAAIPGFVSDLLS